MLRSLVLLAVVCLTAADDVPGGFRGLVEPRLIASGIRIARLEKEINGLKQKIEDAAKIDPARFINEINARLDDAEPKRCSGERDVYCGRDSVECVSSLVMCDGVNDCHNGWDEDEDTCDAGPIKAGNVFAGTVTWKSCRLRKDHPVQFQIVGVAKPKFFGARLGVRVRVTVDWDEEDSEHHHVEHHDSYELKGYYVYGKKRLVLVPVDTDSSEKGIVCTFNRGDDKRAECHLVSESTLSNCADFFVTLQEPKH